MIVSRRPFNRLQTFVLKFPRVLRDSLHQGFSNNLLSVNSGVSIPARIAQTLNIATQNWLWKRLHFRKTSQIWPKGFSDASMSRCFSKVSWRHYYRIYASPDVKYAVASDNCMLCLDKGDNFVFHVLK